MFSKLSRLICCACCASAAALTAVPTKATNLEITEDTVLDATTVGITNIFVRGDAKLTVAGDATMRVLAQIKLFDTASLVLESGRIEKAVWILGSDNQVDFLGGKFAEQLMSGDGTGVVNVDGTTEFEPEIRFTGGSQVVNLRSYNLHITRPLIASAPDLTVNAYSFAPFADRYGDFYTVLFGVPLLNQPPGTFGGVLVGNENKWHVFANDDRPAGDTNSDGVVDLEDLNNVRNNFGSLNQSGKTLPLDGSIVDLDDLNTVRNQFGMGTPISNPVPEPSAMVLGFAALAGIPLLRRWMLTPRTHQSP